MSTDNVVTDIVTDPKTVVIRYVEAVRDGDLALIRDSFAEDASWTYLGEVPVLGRVWQGRDTIVDEFLGGAGALFAKLGVKPQDNDFSKGLNDGAAKEMAKLESLDGQAFDREYARNELAYHQTVNHVVGDVWISNIQNAEVKAFLTQALVTFRVHEEHAGHMVSALR